MNPVAVALIGGFCISEALYNNFIGLQSKKNPDFQNHTALFTGMIGCLAVSMLFVASYFSGGMELTSDWWVPVLITGGLIGGYLYAEVKAFSIGDVSLVAPIASTTPASIILASMIILGEMPSRMGWLGICFVVTGTYIVNIQGYFEQRNSEGYVRRWRDWLVPLLMLKKSVAIRYAYLCVIIATIAINYEAMAVRRANVAFATACIFGIGTIINLAIAYRGGITRKSIGSLMNRYTLVVAICLFFSVWLPNLAFRYEIVPYVGALKRFQILLTIILAYWIMGEKKNFKSRFVGACIMVAGLVLIVSG
ncbi:MAG: hypothetical protein A2655_02015 [Candidatus Yanofskybacteria bacterium RIFCSPHIGHO2_01_FULL_43_42]|uniref:EamA domain-containing protein n=1 Tax=Candidatus Yanofskybacteria bacterium RIFCSPLOWO2_01_FULL_43_22 TaxID=1802695 RepID=A0A1F8GHY7_9BACT|nr:MAG: hypothetical protein A2655_02015 [Candidatus Yanofskybacteria bacterium RIFCSPHIGHO2_01_FULL_43_42]OGN13245.1 MAG: hypothetical protein A3D48_02920 [Candidatus Yanofskybacteria bacterium RIFCSPHIGHO2_02_FULL_43_17]OGN24660.1 MAG: hypothetical protein A3A13_01145 [Candidatus Yanofskybacteria bacterium RIFCSPLOWO2_01_FULL_43_22]